MLTAATKQHKHVPLMDEYRGRVFGAYQPGDQAASTVFFHGAVFQTVYLWTNSMMHRTPEVYMWGECGHMGSALSCIESSYSRPPPTVPCPHFFFDMCCGKCWSAEVCLFFWFMYYVPLVIVCGEQNYRNIHIPFQEKFASPCWWNCWREFWWQLSA